MNWPILIAAMIQVESSGNDLAFNEEEHAYGCLQIRQCVLDDVNGEYGTDYTLEQCYSQRTSRVICRLYLTMWGRQYVEDVAGMPDEQAYARMWNGGPKGWCNPKTEKYWTKVEKELNK